MAQPLYEADNKIQLLRHSCGRRAPFTELAYDMPSPAEAVEIRFTIAAAAISSLFCDFQHYYAVCELCFK